MQELATDGLIVERQDPPAVADDEPRCLAERPPDGARRPPVVEDAMEVARADYVNLELARALVAVHGCSSRLAVRILL